MINTITLNPAVDKILYVDEFKRNITTRIKRVLDTIGGKGTHVSINLSLMGDKSGAYGFTHGMTGKKVLELMGEYENIDLKFIHSEENNTRTNYLLNEKNGDSTLITEKGVMLSKEDIDELIALLDKTTKEGDFLVFSGDASNYPDPYVYNYILDNLKHKQYKVFLDTSGMTLGKCIEHKPFLIKPNLDELSFLLGRDIADEDEEIMRAIDELDDTGVKVIAVSLGGRGSIVKAGGKFFRALPPRIQPLNTVGCGDCFLAGLLHGFSKGNDIEEILRYATAVSAAAAMCELSVGFDEALLEDFMKQATIERI